MSEVVSLPVKARPANVSCVGPAFDLCPEALAIVAGGRIHYCNRAFARLFEHSAPEELQGQTLSAVIPAGHTCTQILEPQAITEAYRCGYNTCVYEGKRKDGTARRIESHCTEFDWDGGKWIILSARDITNRERRRVARETEARFRAIFQASPIGIWQSTLDGRIVESNAALQEMLGYSAQELRGSDFRSYMAEENRGDDHLFGELVAGGREKYERETRFLRKNGGSGIQLLRLSLLRGPDGRPEFLLGLTEDITERKEAEQQLRNSQKMEAIGRLVAGVSHDFNNLLMGISLYSGLLASCVEPTSRAAHYVDEVKLATEQGASLIRQLLTISRQQPSAPKLVRIKDVVEQMEEMLGRLVGENITLRTRLLTEGLIRIDKGQLQQIILNLVLNARDAMPEGGNIQLETEDLPANQVNSELSTGVVLRVTDDGVGMDEATRSRLFEPFFTTKGDGRGNGLGLATVFRIAQEAHARIAVQSAPGKGSRFEITFPAPEKSEEYLAPSVEDESFAGGHERVLLVEDNDLIRGSLGELLRNAGYLVLTAANGEEALGISREQPTLDLLVTDLAMPGMSGLDLARTLRRERSDFAVICISGYDRDHATAEFWDNEGIAFVPKPFSPPALLRRIRQVLDASSSSLYVGKER